jgi:hypothetical protein
MFMKICVAAAVALGFIVTVPSAPFAAGDNDQSVSSTKATVHHNNPKKGWSDWVHENADYRPSKPKKGFSDAVHESASYDRPSRPKKGFSDVVHDNPRY